MALFELFDMPTTRNTKGADQNAVKRASTKRSAPVSIRGGGLIEQIATINSLVERKLGKYKDDYTYFMQEGYDEFVKYIDDLINIGYVAFDTETQGLDPISDHIVGDSFYAKGLKACYIPLHHESYVTGIEVEGQITEQQMKEQLQRLVDHNVKFIMFNGKFDRRVCHNSLGIDIPVYYDGLLAARLLNENEPSNKLKTLHSKYVLDGKEDEFSFDKFFKDIVFSKVPIKSAYIYGAHDSVDTWELWEWQLPYLTKDNALCKEYGLEKVSEVFWNIEMPCLPVLAEMEDNGIHLDLKYADELSKKYHKLEDECLDKFYKAVDMYKNEIQAYRISHPNNKLGDPINIASPQQLAILLYDIIGLDAGVDKKTKKPIRGTGDDILEGLDNPVTEAVREYRKVDKLLSTYIDKLPECINPVDGKLHCNYNQYGAKTGRMSSDNPNLQNIPSHNHDIRKMFVATNREYFVQQTPDNTFFVNKFTEVETKDGWKFADKLVAGDLLVVEDDEFVKVDSIYVDVNRIEIFWSDYS